LEPFYPLCGSKFFVELVLIFSNAEYWRNRGGLSHVDKIPKIFLNSGLLNCSLDVLLNPEYFGITEISSGYLQGDILKNFYPDSFLVNKNVVSLSYLYLLNIRFLTFFKEAWEHQHQRYLEYQGYGAIKKKFYNSRDVVFASDFQSLLFQYNIFVQNDVIRFLDDARFNVVLFPNDDVLFKKIDKFILFMHYQFWK